MTLTEIFFDPFLQSHELKRALAASLAVSIAGAPLGVMLIIRRMALAGDVLTHTLLPGIAVAFLLAGQQPIVMIAGGTVSGLIAVYLTMLVSRSTILREDTSLAAFYMISLSVGVLLLAYGAHEAHGPSFAEGARTAEQSLLAANQSAPHGHGDMAEELLHILFGNALEIDRLTLLTIAIISTGSLVVFAFIYRLLVLESFDPVFLRSVGGGGAFVHLVFMTLVILNLIAGATTIGTMMVIGLMTVPGAAARMWTQDLGAIIGGAIGMAMFSSVTGLLAGHHLHVPHGPAIILIAGILFVISVLFGRQNGIVQRFRRPAHLDG